MGSCSATIILPAGLKRSLRGGSLAVAGSGGADDPVILPR